MSSRAADDVSVVIATRGSSPFFHEALESALAEGAAEVLVVADGAEVVTERPLPAGVRVLRLGSVGRSAARNAGVAAASTPFVAFLDDDDVALPRRLERLRTRLERSPSSPLAFGPVRVVDAAGNAHDEWNELLARRFRTLSESGRRFADVLEARCPIYTSATMVRRDAFLEVGGYDPPLDSYEDLDLYLRLTRLGALAACQGEPVALYRLHGSNTSSERLYEGGLAVTAKHLPRTSGRERRLLVEWRVDALWGLRRYSTLRREAARAALRDPLLLARRRFTKRLAGAALPTRVLESRR